MSQLATPTTFNLNSPSRPMLARDADSMYWMSRYVERAEHIARILLVNSNVLTDVGDLTPHLQQKQWQSILTIFRLNALEPTDHNGEGPADRSVANQIVKYMTFDEENPNSLLNCIARARENARSIRENISAEMWENLNTLYWSIVGEDAPARFEDSPDTYYRSIMTGSMLFQGLTDQTLAHDQRWNFTQLAKYLERIDTTSRVIETKFTILRSAEAMLEAPIRNIHWMAVLRSCCSIEAYRKAYSGDMDPLRVASFLILRRDFPRSIRYAVSKAHDAITNIRRDVNPSAIDSAERVLGRLDAQLEYAEMSEILIEGLPAYLQKLQASIDVAAVEVQKAYFLH
ncbi:alpha-E domain-containing protein [soil metagenome]